MPTSSRAKATALAGDGAASAVRVLKKYPNRRLYDTRTSSYITLADVKRMVLSGEDFEVVDAKSGEDLTRSILLQIILEEESGGVPMFSTQTLAQIIRIYGHAMQGLMGSMLEQNLQAFAEMQAQFLNPASALVDTKTLSPEVWTQFISGQAPVLQNVMGGYLEQSRTMLEQMQQQMQDQMKAAGALFPGVSAFTPGGAPAAKPAPSSAPAPASASVPANKTTPKATQDK